MGQGLDVREHALCETGLRFAIFVESRFHAIDDRRADDGCIGVIVVTDGHLIDFGLDELGEGTTEKGEPELVIRCAFEDFGRMQQAIEARGLSPTSAQSEYVALSLVELPEEKATEVLKMIDALEQDEDVQHVFHNLA